MRSSILTSSRREFINVAHMLADTVILDGAPFVIKIYGGRNVKKSLAVDAFLYALEHNLALFMCRRITKCDLKNTQVRPVTTW